jgi:PAS domain S-box-containing protein
MSSSVLKNVIHAKPATTPQISPSDDAREIAPLNAAGEASSRSDGEVTKAMGVLVENAPVAMAMFDKGMRYLLANRQWVREFGLQQVQPLVGRSQYEIFPNLHPGWRQVYDRALQGHIVRSEHDADGSSTVYRWEVRPWRRISDATVGGLMVTCEKFTSGLARQEVASEKPAEEGTGAAPILPDPFDCNLAMLLLDEKGTIQRVNASAARLALEKGIVEGKTALWEVFAAPAGLASLRDQWNENLPHIIQAPESSVRPLHSLQPDEAEPARWLLTALRRGKSSQQGCPGLLAVLVPSELLPTEIAAPAPPAAIFYPPAPEVVAPPAPVIPPETIQKLENELSRAKQELRTMMEAEKGFVKREARLRGFLESIPCGIFVLDERGATIYQNERLAKLLGRAIDKEAGIEAWLVHGCPTTEHREHVTLAWRESVWRRQLTRTVSLATADGLLKEIEFQPVALSTGGMLVSIQDVTENCRHEEQMRSMEAKMRTMLQSNPIAIVLTDKSGVIFEVNTQAEQLLGQPKAELRRYPLDAWLDPDSATARRDALRVLRSSSSQPEALGVRIKRTDGTFSEAVLNLAIVPDAQGEPHCTIHFFMPAVEEPLIEPAPLENRLEPTPTPAPPPVPVTETIISELLATDANGRIAAWSPQAQEIFDFDAATAVGRPLHLLFRPSDATGFFAELAQQSLSPESFFDHSFFGAQGRGSMGISVQAREEGGYSLHIRREITVTPKASPSVESLIENETTTESSEAAPAIRATRMNSTKAFQVVSPSSDRWPVVNLERERLMLSETHHRIKNHLQIISSLLNMQINGVSDQHARDALRSSQNRVRAIAALHQHLYQLALGGGGTFSDFTRELIQHLRECYEVPAEQIATGLAIQDGSIDPEWLMPLALALNEALSNSFEHAFPHGRQGSITATLRYSGDNGELIIRDDGVGLPSEFHPGESPGLGLKILAVFAEQMRGQLFVQGTPDQGTEIKLRFPTGSAAPSSHAN